MPSLRLITITSTLTVARRCRFLLALGVTLLTACVLANPSPAQEKTLVRVELAAAEFSEADPPPQLPEAASLPAPAATGNAPCNTFCNGIRPQDEIQLVNTRQICGPCCEPESILKEARVEHFAVCDEVGHRKWQPSDLNSVLTFDPSVPTVIFVHGNQISPWDAKVQGLAVYRRLALYACNTPRIRVIIFSWPSSKVSGGTINDVRVKAARTGPAGCQLAWLIDQLPPEVPLGLTGFSFGARIITGSLHILAGGSLGGSLCLAEHLHPERPPIGVCLMASAVHSHWLGDGQYHGLACTQVSRMCLINNCDDPAMKYYDFIEPGFGGPQALGLCGPTCISRENARKVFNRDVSCSVGNVHELNAYIYAPGDAGLMWQFTVGSTNTVTP
jgi:hypothetical protein